MTSREIWLPKPECEVGGDPKGELTMSVTYVRHEIRGPIGIAPKPPAAQGK